MKPTFLRDKADAWYYRVRTPHTRSELSVDTDSFLALVLLFVEMEGAQATVEIPGQRLIVRIAFGHNGQRRRGESVALIPYFLCFILPTHSHFFHIRP
jgi:hypothetical protein